MATAAQDPQRQPPVYHRLRQATKWGSVAGNACPRWVFPHSSSLAPGYRRCWRSPDPHSIRCRPIVCVRWLEGVETRQISINEVYLGYLLPCNPRNLQRVGVRSGTRFCVLYPARSTRLPCRTSRFPRVADSPSSLPVGGARACEREMGAPRTPLSLSTL